MDSIILLRVPSINDSLFERIRDFLLKIIEFTNQEPLIGTLKPRKIKMLKDLGYHVWNKCVSLHPKFNI